MGQGEPTKAQPRAGSTAACLEVPCSCCVANDARAAGTPEHQDDEGVGKGRFVQSVQGTGTARVTPGCFLSSFCTGASAGLGQGGRPRGRPKAALLSWRWTGRADRLDMPPGALWGASRRPDLLMAGGRPALQPSPGASICGARPHDG